VVKNLVNKYRSMSPQVKAGIWFFVCNVVQKGIGVITTPIFTRLMTTDQYGIYTIYQSWRDILSIFITFAMASSVYMKKMVDLDTQKEKNQLTCALQGLATLTTIIGLIIYLPFRDFWNQLLHLPTMAVLCIFVSVLFTTGFDFWAARARINYKYRALVIVTILVAVFKPVAAIIAMKNVTETAYARIYSVTGVELICFFSIYLLNFASREKPYNGKYWKYAMLFVLPLIPHFLSQRILSQSDRIMIESMVGKSEAGIYGLANSIGWILSIVVTSIDGVMAPWAYSNIKSNNYGQIKKISLYTIIGMALLSFGFIIIAPEVVSIFAPAEYHEAIWTLPPLIISTYLMLVYFYFIYFEYYFEETKKIMIATVSSAALNIALNFYCIRLFGYIAAGYTTLVCYMAYTLFHYFAFVNTCKKHGISQNPYNTKLFLLVSVLLTAVGLGAMALYNLPIARYLLIGVLFIIAILRKDRIISVYRDIQSGRK